MVPLALRQIGAAEKILMNTDGAVGLAAPAKQIAEREMQLDRFRVQLDDFDKRIDGLIRLLVQQKIEAAKIRPRQVGALGKQRLQVVACRDPAERERHGDNEQPPEI